MLWGGLLEMRKIKECLERLRGPRVVFQGDYLLSG